MKQTNIELASILSNRTKEGMVELLLQNINDDGFPAKEIKIQMDITKAKEVHRMLGEAIEAAVSDTIIYKFFREKVKFDEEKAVMVLLDFRELRQGSKKTVYIT